MKITKRVEFDSGHRLPGVGKCSNLHGHRFVLEATLAGEIENGMILDFSAIKTILREAVVDRWDHAFLVWKEDSTVREFLTTMPGHKTVVTEDPPTVETLARDAYLLIEKAMERAEFTARLESIRLYETPNSWADFKRNDTKL